MGGSRFGIAPHWLLSRARVRRVIDAVMGTVLVALGVRIAVQGN